jgi:hypothetical protein
MLTRRFGRIQPFADINSREDNRYSGIQLGLTTYSTPDDGGEEQYQTSYYEFGARCDHLADPLMDLFNVEHEPQTASNATASDARRLRKADDKSADKSIGVTA